jgi:DNA-binding response OmpR family regulator
MQSVDEILDRLAILFIVDDLDPVEPLVESLRSAGAVVVAVRTAALALAYSDRHSVDAILVDLREAGWWATTEMRALRSLSRVPLYVITEPNDPTPDATAHVAGYFPKPVQVEELIATLRRLPRR